MIISSIYKLNGNHWLQLFANLVLQYSITHVKHRDVEGQKHILVIITESDTIKYRKDRT
jgi:hypothetical protein